VKFYFVHGAWHGDWCWKNVRPLLENRGHTVIANDLPGLGNDQTPAAEITLVRYRDAVCESLEKEREPVILVGHSMGGIVITEVAERMPEKVKALVYLTAYLLRSGESLLSAVGQDEEARKLVPHVDFNGPVCTIKPEMIREFFYGDCSPDDAAWAESLLRPQPIAPLDTPVQVTAQRFGQVPRFYIQCLSDRALPLSLQEKMLAASPCEKVLSMETAHSPFLSAPDELVARLLELVGH
jgi:pimeloyl-ACP methyl ester carboxylesterase